MTADTPTHRDDTSPGHLPQTLMLTFAGLTLFFALLSFIIGSRLSTLQTNYLTAAKETVTSETASIDTMKTALDTATGDLQTALQALNAEKTTAEKLRQHLSTTQKALEKTKADLASANQAINDLNSTPSVKPEPTIETKPGTAPAPDSSNKEQPALEKELPPPLPASKTSSPPVPSPPVTQPPDTPTSETKLPSLPTGGPTIDNNTLTPAVVEPSASEHASPVAEKTTGD